jgi:dUTP pyrophosphatase
MRVQFTKTDPRAVVPTYATDGASGLDLVALEVTPRPYGADVRTGIAIELPDGYEAQVRPRSGLARRGWAAVLGTIDSDYRGEIGVTLWHAPWRLGGIMRTLHEQMPRPGDRVAQLVIAPVSRVELVEAESLGETGRGAGGFGSTGR